MGTGRAVTQAELTQARSVVDAVGRTLGTRLVGQERLGTALLVALLAEGHVLVESVPGLAKTLAASTLAQATGGVFSRIQCTPDLLPSDVVGTEVYDARNASFDTRLGPVHANVVLLDEVNRASAKTQSAMLEAMQERHTTIGGVTHPLPSPFVVLATMNPVEQEGTYPLPEAQLDRFLLKVVLDYPSAGQEAEILDRVEAGILGAEPEPVAPATTLEDLRAAQEVAGRIHVADSVKRYIVDLVRLTRDPGPVLGAQVAAQVELGASPRASITFLQVARAVALLQGRDHVVPEDVRHLGREVLRHRLLLTFEAVAGRVSPDSVVDAVLAAVPTP